MCIENGEREIEALKTYFESQHGEMNEYKQNKRG